MYTAGTIAFIAILIIILKFPRHWMRRLLWLDIPIDIFVTALLMSLLAGSYDGMMAALLGGLIFSITLWAMKLYMGYERPRFSTRKPWFWWEEQ